MVRLLALLDSKDLALGRAFAGAAKGSERRCREGNLVILLGDTVDCGKLALANLFNLVKLGVETGVDVHVVGATIDRRDEDAHGRSKIPGRGGRDRRRHGCLSATPSTARDGQTASI